MAPYFVTLVDAVILNETPNAFRVAIAYQADKDIKARNTVTGTHEVYISKKYIQKTDAVYQIPLWLVERFEKEIAADKKHRLVCLLLAEDTH